MNLKDEHLVIGISVFVGISMWVVDAAMGAAFFSRGSFLDLLFLKVPGHDLLFRIIFLASFVLFGLIMSQFFSRQSEMRNMVIQAKKEWEEAFDIINDAITIHDKDFNIIRANRAAEKILGVPFQAILGRKCFHSYHGTDTPPDSCPSCKTLKTGKPCVTEIFEPSLNKHIEVKALPRFDRDNTLAGVVHIVRDVTDRVEAEKKLRSLSQTDDLTGLLNRRGFMTLAEKQQKVARRMGKGFHILTMEIDGLEEIVAAFGHDTWCAAMRETATILSDCFRESDIIARFGNGEFVVFLMQNNENGNGVPVIRRLQEKVGSWNAGREEGQRLSMRTGIAYCPPDRKRPLSEMLKEADEMMNSPKKDTAGS